MRPRKLRRLLVAVAAGTVLAGTGIGYAADANAEPVSGCQDDLWFVLFQSTRRAICDGPIRPDGSWLRARVRYTPEHYKPLRTSCYGTYSISCTTTGGYWVPYSEAESTTYIVFPHNRLPDEPPHLVNGFAV